MAPTKRKLWGMDADRHSALLTSARAQTGAGGLFHAGTGCGTLFLHQRTSVRTQHAENSAAALGPLRTDLQLVPALLPNALRREKRTSSPANYRFMSRTKLRGQMLRNKGGDRRSRLTLSLDVPTNIMNVLFDVAKAKNLRAKAAENARLLAQIGRRK
ncbi:hypothetical protein OJAV_G00224100 [Oryzias javanicus]|uniref:Corticotropin-releasing factor domain-containing protein n=1 Tax=Oryzias javanicus TaxID=123683 RepID=A0A3S2NQ99_ORYJA|nr:hypothetical protein OJAV_G00224100 [Oryzias javanicus]